MKKLSILFLSSLAIFTPMVSLIHIGNSYKTINVDYLNEEQWFKNFGITLLTECNKKWEDDYKDLTSKGAIFDSNSEKYGFEIAQDGNGDNLQAKTYKISSSPLKSTNIFSTTGEFVNNSSLEQKFMSLSFIEKETNIISTSFISKISNNIKENDYVFKPIVDLDLFENHLKIDITKSTKRTVFEDQDVTFPPQSFVVQPKSKMNIKYDAIRTNYIEKDIVQIPIKSFVYQIPYSINGKSKILTEKVSSINDLISNYKEVVKCNPFDWNNNFIGINQGGTNFQFAIDMSLSTQKTSIDTKVKN